MQQTAVRQETVAPEENRSQEKGGFVADRDFIAQLSAIDFGPIAYKLMNPTFGEPWSLERTTQAVEQYRMFLFLLKHYPTRKIVPSIDVDEVWHTHILDTAKYREDCDTLFGRFVDHWPYFGLVDEEDKLEAKDAFAETQGLLKSHFGVVYH